MLGLGLWNLVRALSYVLLYGVAVLHSKSKVRSILYFVDGFKAFYLFILVIGATC